MPHAGVRSTPCWYGGSIDGAARWPTWSPPQTTRRTRCRFVSLTEALDVTTATGRAMAGLLSVFATMRSGALDRFGTRLERRFTASEISRMMEAAGLERVTFNDSLPFWCAIGYRKARCREEDDEHQARTDRPPTQLCGEGACSGY